jgi:hypothetical protein
MVCQHLVCCCIRSPSLCQPADCTSTQSAVGLVAAAPPYRPGLLRCACTAHAAGVAEVLTLVPFGRVVSNSVACTCWIGPSQLRPVCMVKPPSAACGWHVLVVSNWAAQPTPWLQSHNSLTTPHVLRPNTQVLWCYSRCHQAGSNACFELCGALLREQHTQLQSELGSRSAVRDHATAVLSRLTLHTDLGRLCCRAWYAPWDTVGGLLPGLSAKSAWLTRGRHHRQEAGSVWVCLASCSGVCMASAACQLWSHGGSVRQHLALLTRPARLCMATLQQLHAAGSG